MSKFLATAAEVIGGVALIATGLGSIPGLGIGATALHTIQTVAKVASFVCVSQPARAALISA